MNENNNVFPVDELYERAIKFSENKREKYGSGLSNLYVIQKTDLDGNVIDEYYGMNLLTDYGMSQYFVSGTTFPTNIYIGNGTGSFNHTTNVLLSPITTTASTLSSSTKAYNYPLYYDSLSGLITCVARYCVGYFDYNITGITDTINITEYGIGTAYNALWTHSWVYDITGAQTYITKNINERLIITVYMCLSYYESLITNGWDSKRYAMITTMQNFFDNKMYELNLSTYKRNAINAVRTKSNASSALVNNEITRYSNMSAFTLEDGTTAATGYIDGFAQWTSGMVVLEPQQLSTPEAFDVITFPQNTLKNGLSNTFGHANFLPFTQADISSVALFNYDTGLYDNYETFTNNASHDYCETSMSIAYPAPLYYTNNNTIVTMYVFQNTRTDDPILSLNEEIGTLYATDKYWDVSTWSVISNFNDIPIGLQTKRYWIASRNDISLEPVRQSGEFRIHPTAGDLVTYSYPTSGVRECFPVCDNYEYGWCSRGDTVYCLNTEISFSNTRGDTAITMTYGKWMLVFSSTTTYRLYDMSDLSVEPTATVVSPPFGSSTNLFTGTVRSETGAGLICLQSIANNESVIIDLRNDNHISQVFSSKKAIAIWGNNQIAYIPIGTTDVVRVYDFTSNGDIREFTIPVDSSTITLMVALRDYVWITNGSSYTYVMDIRDGSIESCTYILPTPSPLYRTQITAVDKALIYFAHGNGGVYNMSNHYCVKYDDPLNPMNLSELEPTGSNAFNVNDTLRYVHDNTLVLIHSRAYYSSYWGSCNTVIDFGQYLKTGVVKKWEQTGNQLPNYIPYGEFIMKNINNKTPIEYFLPHRIIGTTKTITALNVMKNVSGKQWATTITNIPEFNGLPPGVKQ